MKDGDSLTFLVDDPLVLKSVPEELDSYPNVTYAVQDADNGWIISVQRSHN